ncbi:MAG: D-2-hydroxyacid dehydrogenase [Rhizobiales bacterium]|nr:D-2-hydroxyacid dehydrogenase [Hyphomicrobiales bacterium]
MRTVRDRRRDETFATMPRLLILLTLPPNVRDYYAARLKKRFPELEIDVADHYSKAIPLAPNADILLTFGPMMKDEVFANAPKLKWVQALGTGVDGVIDQPSLGKNVTVTNIRGIHGAPVSEAAIMGMLALSRDLPRSVRSQDQNSWTRWPPKLLDNKTVGIYGIGLIAEALAPRCKAFGMTVVGYSSTKREVPGIDRMLLRSDLIATAKELDYLVLLVPYSEETRHSINANVFAAMKPSAFLINLARGGVVEEDSMVEALNSGKIAGAALDVFQTEPLPADHPLWSMKNVIITPHLGGFCDVYADLALVTVEHNMECWLRGDIDGMRDLVRK